MLINEKICGRVHSAYLEPSFCHRGADGGGTMPCYAGRQIYWAGQAVLGVGIVLVVLSLLHLAFKNDGMKLGLDLAVIANAALLMLIPNHLIHLCMKNHMRCHTVMEPFVLIMGVLMIAAALGDFFFRRRVVKKEAAHGS